MVTRTLRRITLVLLTSLLLFQITHAQVYEKKVVPLAPPGLPVRLVIPAISVNANIQSLGITPSGEMAVPSNIVDVGWFNLGPRPGKKGSAVIAGHFNGPNNQAGVFVNLDKLKVGDRLSVIDSRGVSTTFTVRQKRVYDSGYADDVFGRNDAAHLNLVTCDGLWDGTKKSYSQRLVVFTDFLQLY